jgi:hypothetical protein
MPPVALADLDREAAGAALAWLREPARVEELATGGVLENTANALDDGDRVRREGDLLGALVKLA